MNTKDTMQEMLALQKKMTAYQYAQSIVYFDFLTAAPKDSIAGRSDCMAMISEELYKLFFNPEVGAKLEFLMNNSDGLSVNEKREIVLMKEEYDKNFKIPMDEYVAYSVLCNEAGSKWQECKQNNDFASYRPYLEKIFDTLKRFSTYKNPDADPYEVWLDEHEKGLTRKLCDEFFADLREKLAPLILKIQQQPQIDTRCVEGSFDIDKQRALTTFLTELMTISEDRCVIGEVEHPCCFGLNCDDVRLTTHYYENMLTSSLFSVVHEGGHALYDLGASPDYRNTIMAQPRSTSIHESQSRFFENYIARSPEFAGVLLPKLKELFPQFADVTADQLYRAVNKAEPSLIRIEADELTYSMHIMIRYEIEKMLFDGVITTHELPETWNRLYKEYLGVDVPDDKTGVLQDVHWSDGLVGYFPSYALGSAYAAQMLAAMQKDIDVFSFVAKGDLKPIVDWLGEHVHKDAGFPDAQDVILKACGAPFSPKFYTAYLTNKYSALYGIQ